MRKIPQEMLASLSGGATNLCSCWRVTRRDGAVLGFTDHDRDISFDDVTYAASSGLESSAFEGSSGLSVGGGEVSGALSSGSLSEADLANGAFDDARVEIFRVDWSAPQNRLLLEAAVIGEVRRSEHGFVAELRSLAHVLDQERGRLYHASCDADVGDARCNFDFNAAPFVMESECLKDSDAMNLFVPAQAIDAAWWVGGRVEILTGANAGARVNIRAQRSQGEVHVIMLWTRLSLSPNAGDRLRLFAGCDKSFGACRTKFANSANFRGFPHMPGNDHVLSYGKRGAGMDGGSLVR